MKRDREHAIFTADGESVVRQFSKSAQAAVRGAKPDREHAIFTADSESVVRQFSKSLYHLK